MSSTRASTRDITITTTNTRITTIMSIDWLEAESAIDERLALQAQREKLEAAYLADKSDAEAALRLLNVLDQLGVPAPEMAQLTEPAMHANPNDAALMAWLGQLSYRLGELKLAMVTLKHAIALDPGDTLANFTLGQCMLYAGAHEDALRYAQQAMENGQAAHYRKDIGRLYCIVLARLKRFEEAYKFQLEQLAERPEDTQAIIDTSDLLSEMGRAEESLQMLLDAHKKKPSDTELLFRLAVTKFEDNDFAAAIGWADKLLAVDAQHLEGWNLRAQAKYKLGLFDGAIADHSMILELSKSMPLDQSFVASCYEGMGNKEAAIAALKKGLIEAKDWPDRKKQYQQHLDRLQIVPPSQQQKKHNLGPNDPCWCGSGKKLKKCHGS
ncbi:MAG: SEC-C domain-containing protein [Planctomycetes bacterium]|nr:SEC-C domain-containing protein [Planctomycetota bacterium]